MKDDPRVTKLMLASNLVFAMTAGHYQNFAKLKQPTLHDLCNDTQMGVHMMITSASMATLANELVHGTVDYQTAVGVEHAMPAVLTFREALEDIAERLSKQQDGMSRLAEVIEQLTVIDEGIEVLKSVLPGCN